MSTTTENEFDLEKLFLPAWAQNAPAANKFAQHPGERERSDDRGDRRGSRPPRRDAGGGGGQRPRLGASGPRRDGGRGKFGGDQRGPRREEQRAPAPPAPLAELNVTFTPDENGVESLARQIKMTGRAYPLFQIARMILEKHERHSITFSVKKNAEGAAIQPLFLCALDDTPWLSEADAVAHVLRKHFATFYSTERTPTEPPKGVYTFVAQCGLSGAILGPPNYHDYQNKLRKLHTEKFARMPFDMFKARVKIVKDEAVVKKWIEDQSFKTEFVCLNVPEPLRFATMEEVEKHFREVHLANIIKPVESVKMTGVNARSLHAPELKRVLRAAWDHQFGFPISVATGLSQSFANHGLQFFKVNKTVTHVSVARPNFLDLETTPVSDSIKRIVEFINAHPKCTRRKLLETLAPAPKPTVIEVKPDAPPVSDAPTAEQTAVIADLHWLIHQGHVLEFADGRMETAKKPVPKPSKPAKVVTDAAKPDEAKQVAAEETISAAEVVATASAEELPPVEPSTEVASPS